jgi:hypothetical protein
MRHTNTKTQLRNLAVIAGLTLYTWSPGDGLTRYRFFDNHHISDYFAADGLFTALGIREAVAFARGYYLAAKKGGAK